MKMSKIIWRLSCAAAGALITAALMTAAHAAEDAGAMRGRVTGIGGIFFKAKDAKKLSAWYVDTLGLPKSKYGVSFGWSEKGKPDSNASTSWATFPESSTYFDPTAARFMVNYRVEDLDAVLARLRKSGSKVDDKITDEGYGRFAWATDPEGNRFELWEPTPGH